MLIGEVAEHAGLWLRTIRYYEEVGLVKDMKPLGFNLDEMRGLLEEAEGTPSSGTRRQELKRASPRQHL